MTTDHHGHSFRHSGASHISNRSAPEVVQDFTREPGIFERLIPPFARVFNRTAFTVKNIRAQQSRGLARNFGNLAFGPLALNRFEQLAL